MVNRYGAMVMRFYESVENYTGRIIGEETCSHPSWFSKDDKDLRAYYAFLDAYHAINDYHAYRAKYNLQDKELEEALANWNKIVNPKKNIFSKMIQKIKIK